MATTIFLVPPAFPEHNPFLLPWSLLPLFEPEQAFVIALMNRTFWKYCCFMTYEAGFKKVEQLLTVSLPEGILALGIQVPCCEEAQAP